MLLSDVNGASHMSRNTESGYLGKSHTYHPAKSPLPERKRCEKMLLFSTMDAKGCSHFNKWNILTQFGHPSSHILTYTHKTPGLNVCALSHSVHQMNSREAQNDPILFPGFLSSSPSHPLILLSITSQSSFHLSISHMECA